MPHLPAHQHFKVHLGKEGVLLARFDVDVFGDPQVAPGEKWRYNWGITYNQKEQDLNSYGKNGIQWDINPPIGDCLNKPCMVMSGMVLGCWGMNLPCNSNDLPSWGKLQSEG